MTAIFKDRHNMPIAMITINEDTRIEPSYFKDGSLASVDIYVKDIRVGMICCCEGSIEYKDLQHREIKEEVRA